MVLNFHSRKMSRNFQNYRMDKDMFFNKIPKIKTDLDK